MSYNDVSQLFVVVLLTLFVTSCSSTPPTKPPEPTATAIPTEPDKPFAGVEINILTMDEINGSISEPLLRRVPDFEALTGATINIDKIPFGELYDGPKSS